MTAAVAIERDDHERGAPAAEQLDDLTAFRERCDAAAARYAAGEQPLIDAVDALQNTAIAYGLVQAVGQDAIQQIMSETFAPVRAAQRADDSRRHRVAASTLDAAVFLAEQNDPERLRAWLARHSADECAAIWQHLQSRGAKCR